MNNYDISYEYDIVPELLEKIKADFFTKAEKSAELERLLILVRSGKANFIDAHEFATKLGQILSEALQMNISGSILPDGKMHFNIASRILNETLGTNHKMVSSYAKQVQEILNKEAGIGLKSIQAPINQERIDGLVNRLSYEDKFDDVSWILKEPIVNFNQNIVDNHIKVNADFHFKSGLKPKIVRTTDGNCCDWCSKLAGVYTYPGVNRDVFRRHDRCTCTVDYHPGDGKQQNSWSKKWSNESTSRADYSNQREHDISDNLASEDRREYKDIVKSLGRSNTNVSLQEFVRIKNERGQEYHDLKDKVKSAKSKKTSK